MPLRQSQFDTLLTPMIYHHFEVGQNLIPSMRSQLFNVQNSTLSAEKGVGLGGMSVDAWDQYNGNGIKGELEFDDLYTQTYTHVEYPVRLNIEKKLLLNDQYGRIQTMIQRAGMSAEQKMEKDAASVFNNAFSGVTYSDGVELCSASHPVGPHDSGNLYSNTGTAALTKANLKTARLAVMRFKDDKGNEIGVMPDELIVPPELEEKAHELVESVLTPEDANTASNFNNGKWRVISWQRLSDTNNWFVSSSAWRSQLLRWYNREALQVMLYDESTTHLTYELKLHYSFGVDDWRWIYGNAVSGS